MKQQEGKIPLLKSHFEFIAQKTMQSPKDFNLNMFAHLFLTLTWSLIARSASTALAGFSMFGWSGDAMTLKLPKSKCAIVDFIQIRCLLKFEFAFLVVQVTSQEKMQSQNMFLQARCHRLVQFCPLRFGHLLCPQLTRVCLGKNVRKKNSDNGSKLSLSSITTRCNRLVSIAMKSVCKFMIFAFFSICMW